MAEQVSPSKYTSRLIPGRETAMVLRLTAPEMNSLTVSVSDTSTTPTTSEPATTPNSSKECRLPGCSGVGSTRANFIRHRSIASCPWIAQVLQRFGANFSEEERSKLIGGGFSIASETLLKQIEDYVREHCQGGAPQAPPSQSSSQHEENVDNMPLSPDSSTGSAPIHNTRQASRKTGSSDSMQEKSCPTPNCDGSGHIMGYRHHRSAADCPLATESKKGPKSQNSHHHHHHQADASDGMTVASKGAAASGSSGSSCGSSSTSSSNVPSQADRTPEQCPVPNCDGRGNTKSNRSHHIAVNRCPNAIKYLTDKHISKEDIREIMSGHKPFPQKPRRGRPKKIDSQSTSSSNGSEKSTSVVSQRPKRLVRQASFEVKPSEEPYQKTRRSSMAEIGTLIIKTQIKDEIEETTATPKTVITNKRKSDTKIRDDGNVKKRPKRAAATTLLASEISQSSSSSSNSSPMNPPPKKKIHKNPDKHHSKSSQVKNIQILPSDVSMVSADLSLLCVNTVPPIDGLDEPIEKENKQTNNISLIIPLKSRRGRKKKVGAAILAATTPPSQNNETVADIAPSTIAPSSNGLSLIQSDKVVVVEPTVVMPPPPLPLGENQSPKIKTRSGRQPKGSQDTPPVLVSPSSIRPSSNDQDSSNMGCSSRTTRSSEKLTGASPTVVSNKSLIPDLKIRRNSLKTATVAGTSNSSMTNGHEQPPKKSLQSLLSGKIYDGDSKSKRKGPSPHHRNIKKPKTPALITDDTDSDASNQSFPQGALLDGNRVMKPTTSQKSLLNPCPQQVNSPVIAAPKITTRRIRENLLSANGNTHGFVATVVSSFPEFIEIDAILDKYQDKPNISPDDLKQWQPTDTFKFAAHPIFTDHMDALFHMERDQLGAELEHVQTQLWKLHHENTSLNLSFF